MSRKRAHELESVLLSESVHPSLSRTSRAAILRSMCAGAIGPLYVGVIDEVESVLVSDELESVLASLSRTSRAAILRFISPCGWCATRHSQVY